MLQAARTLLREVGAEKLSLRGVAKQAGYAPSALYEYFDGKAALIEAVQEMVDVELAGILTAAITLITKPLYAEVLLLLAFIGVLWRRAPGKA